MKFRVTAIVVVQCERRWHPHWHSGIMLTIFLSYLSPQASRSWHRPFCYNLAILGRIWQENSPIVGARKCISKHLEAGQREQRARLCNQFHLSPCKGNVGGIPCSFSETSAITNQNGNISLTAEDNSLSLRSGAVWEEFQRPLVNTEIDEAAHSESSTVNSWIFKCIVREGEKDRTPAGAQSCDIASCDVSCPVSICEMKRPQQQRLLLGPDCHSTRKSVLKRKGKKRLLFSSPSPGLHTQV